jgi:hypothetical protein
MYVSGASLGVGFMKNTRHLLIEYLGFLRIGDVRRVL